MADVPASADSNGDTGVGPDRGLTAVYPGTPRWVKVSGIIVIVLVLLVAIVMATGMFAGGSGHGPARHVPSGDSGGPTLSIAHWVQQL